jgi:hypothetical protein
MSRSAMPTISEHPGILPLHPPKSSDKNASVEDAHGG